MFREFACNFCVFCGIAKLLASETILETIEKNCQPKKRLLEGYLFDTVSYFLIVELKIT